MAAALFNPPLSFFPRHRALALDFPPCRRIQFARSPFKASLKAAKSESKIINGDDVSQIRENAPANMAGQEILLNMKTLIQSYKKAILDGDEESVCKMEAAICSIENEKNVLSQKFSEVTAEIASGKDTFLRLKADLENFRKRSEKYRITSSSDFRGEVFDNLLPMIDSFERSKQQMKPETEKEIMIDTSYQGIYKQFVDIMRSSQVSVVDTVGKPFDPSIHEAIGREESQQFSEGIVVKEVRRGFLLGGRLLRSATVKVSSGPGPRKIQPPREPTIAQPEEAAESVDSS